MNDPMESAVTAEELPAVETAPEQPTPETPAPAEPISEPEFPVMPAPETPQKIKKIKKSRRRPWPLKILLELVAIVLCVALFAVTIAGALIVDLRVMTSQGGFEKILTQMIAPAGSVQAAPQPGVTLLSAPDQSQDAANFVTDMIYDMLQESFGQDMPVTKNQISEFIDKSTVTDFIAEKMSGAVNDFLNETSDTTITKDEIMDLVRDNSALLKESFDIEITDDMMTELETALDEVPMWDELEQKGLVGYLEENLLLPDSETDGGSNGLSDIKQVMAYIRMATSNTAIASFAGAMLLLALLVLLVNWSVPKTLSDIGITLLFAGLILSSLNFIATAGILELMLSEQAAMIGLINGILASVAVVHYGILGTGVALIVLAIIAKIIKNSRRKKAMLEAL